MAPKAAQTVEAVAAPTTEEVPEHVKDDKEPVPPYDNTYDITAGVDCFYPDCSFKACTCWGKLYKHVQGSHKRTAASLKGTFLYDEGKKAMAVYNKAYYERTKESYNTQRNKRRRERG